MDIVFTKFRLALFISDKELIDECQKKLSQMIEQGGDWERRNRLKVYEGLYNMQIRQFKKASNLFLESISTFTSYEVFSYNDFIFYTVLCAVVSLDRVDLREKVIAAPEILQVIREIPNLQEFLNSIYNCKYRDFFVAFAAIIDQFRSDRYLAPHSRYFMREIRVLGYQQFLESYQSVKMDAMASQFGVSVDFLDKELAGFIANGRLNCKIDKVGGIIETTRPDSKNAQYQSCIKQGDLLLNRIQKLSRVIHL